MSTLTARSLADWKALIRQALESDPDAVNPMEDDMCVLTDPMNPTRHCVVGQALHLAGFTDIPIDGDGWTAAHVAFGNDPDASREEQDDEVACLAKLFREVQLVADGGRPAHTFTRTPLTWGVALAVLEAKEIL